MILLLNHVLISFYFCLFKFCRDTEADLKILVKSSNICIDLLPKENLITVDKNHVQKAVISCLEGPLHLLLDKWSKEIKTREQTKHTHHVISEIESIRKQMLFEDTKEAFESDDPSSSTSIVPGTIKEYLFRLVLS